MDAKQREQHIAASAAPKTAAPALESEKSRPKANRSIKLSYKEQRELDALPDEIAALETEQTAVNAQLAEPDIFKDYTRAAELQQRHDTLEALLLEKLERWEILEAKQNGQML